MSGFRIAVGQSPVSHCLNGKWTATPTCIPMTCGPPPRVKHGYPVASTFKRRLSRFGDKVRFICSEGYAFLSGIDISECDKTTKKWLNIPICLKSCGAAPEPKNGFIASRDFAGNASVPGSAVTFRCFDNHYLLTHEGFENFVCGASGQWPKEKLPICRSKLVPDSFPNHSRNVSFVTIDEEIGVENNTKSKEEDSESGLFADPLHPDFPSISPKIKNDTENKNLWLVWNRGQPDEMIKEKVAELTNSSEDGSEIWINPRWKSDNEIIEKIELQHSATLKCDTIPKIDNAIIANDGDYFKQTRISKNGVIVRFECLPGSSFDQSSGNLKGIIVCRENTWSMPLPRCHVISDGKWI